ncbi:hypothetical protein [Polaribacter sp. Z022]|uniref:hypothetical protein n=1 Tax=Polaribacter sp. Z022 TaxID=2927125 RepID=UPI0020220660|nr:hypothetical protein [Polaribacter sp. Z022]MCL7754033.1 hypothetical protein [Polaribacter sp. Z022]
MTFKKISYTIFILLFVSCSKNKISFEKRTSPLNLDYHFFFNDKEDQLNFSMGIWMFNARNESENSIANWINVEHLGKTILEPINVLWIDFKANNKTEAINNIVNFLTLNNFIMRSGSSIGYHSFFDDFKWISQYQETWSSHENPNTINNHGRIFLGHQVKSSLNQNVYISSGAFSIENEKHLFISFKDALKDFNNVDQWKTYDENLNIGNKVESGNFSTFDHEGLKVFVLK